MTSPPNPRPQWNGSENNMKNAKVKEIVEVEVVPGHPQTVEIWRRNEQEEVMKGPTEAVTRLLSEKGWPLDSPTTEVGSWTVVTRRNKQ